MPRLGLLGKTVLVIALVFGGAAVAVDRLYLPWLEARVRGQMDEVTGEALLSSERIMDRWTRHLADRTRRGLSDLPFELTEGSSERTRSLVGEFAAGLGDRDAVNVDFLANEFSARLDERTRERSRDLAGRFRSDALLGLLILLGGVFFLLAATLAVFVLSPLGRLSRATDRVAAGHLDERVGLRSRDEVGRLGDAFDRMTAALAGSRAEIEELNRGLAEKVEEKSRALVHAQTMASLGTLAGGVAHEFNNLLGGILGIAEDAREEDDPEEVRESLAMILRTARRACNITENLLRFSRPPAREARETDLPRLVADALDLIRPEARHRHVEILADLADPGPVEIDPGQIHQVVLNLLTNALHMMPDGGRLAVRVRDAGGTAVIVIEDTGPGVREEDRKRIFEPFFSTREEGTGLGLSVSYSIVRAHGGEIDVSGEPGQGAVFTVRLPIGDGGN